MRVNVRLAYTLGLILIAAVPNLHAAACSNGSIAGKWAFTTSGTLLLPSGPVPVAAVADFTIEPSGHLFGSQTRSLGGQVAEETFTGTLPVNRDCTGEAVVQVYLNGVLARPIALQIVFDDNSRSARGIFTSLLLPDDTSLPTIITLHARKLFPKQAD